MSVLQCKFEWVMSDVWMSHMRHDSFIYPHCMWNKSCLFWRDHMLDWNTSMSHVTYEWVMSHNVRYEWVMSLMNKSWLFGPVYTCSVMIWIRYVPYMNDIYIYIYTYIHIYVYIYTYMNIFIYIYEYIYTYIYTNAHIQTHTHIAYVILINVYTYIHVCVYLCTHTFEYTFIDTQMHIHTHRFISMYTPTQT